MKLNALSLVMSVVAAFAAVASADAADNTHLRSATEGQIVQVNALAAQPVAHNASPKSVDGVQVMALMAGGFVCVVGAAVIVKVAEKKNHSKKKSVYTKRSSLRHDDTSQM